MKKITVEVELSFEIEAIDQLLTTAFEGGSNYWYHTKATNIPKPPGFTRNEEIYYTFLDKIYQGSSMEIYDIETEDFLGTLSMDNIRRGVKLLAEEHPLHFSAWTSGDWDAETADVFFQLVVMGELVFG